MQKELDALEADNTWSLVPLPQGKKCVGRKWVYKIVPLPKGYINWHIPRLDVSNAVLHWDLNEEEYRNLPLGCKPQ